MTSRPNSVRYLLAQGLTTCGRAVNDLVFPWACLVCGFEGAGLQGPFCTSCRSELLETAAGLSVCPRCALPAGPHANLRGGCTRCRGHYLGFDEALALGPYEGTIRDLCLLLKHERNAWLAHWLSDLLAEARNADLLRSTSGCVDRSGSPPLVATTSPRLQSGGGLGSRAVAADRSSCSPDSPAGQGSRSSGIQECQ